MIILLVSLKIMNAFVSCEFDLEKIGRKSIAPEIENLSPALSRGGIVSIATLMARKLEPLIIQSDTKISHTFDCGFKINS